MPGNPAIGLDVIPGCLEEDFQVQVESGPRHVCLRASSVCPSMYPAS